MPTAPASPGEGSGHRPAMPVPDYSPLLPASRIIG